MLLLWFSCMSLIIQHSWTPPPTTSFVAMLGLEGKTIRWGQIELNAGRIGGQNCVTLLSLSLAKERKDCLRCTAASTLRFTDEINNTPTAECVRRLRLPEEMSGKYWSVGYNEQQEIYQFTGEEWIKSAQITEKSDKMLIVQSN